MMTMAASVAWVVVVHNFLVDQNEVSYSAMRVSDCSDCGYCYYATDRIAYCFHKHNSLVAEARGKYFVDDTVVGSILDVEMDLQGSTFFQVYRWPS